MLDLQGFRAIHQLPGIRAVKSVAPVAAMIVRTSKKIDKQIDLLFALSYTCTYTSKKIMFIGGYPPSTSRDYTNDLHAAGLLEITRSRVQGTYNTYKRAKRVRNCSQEARDAFWQHKLALKDGNMDLAKEHLKQYMKIIDNRSA